MAAVAALVKRAEACLANIAKQNGRINALVAVRPAKDVVNDVVASSSSSKSPLSGRIVAIKDNYCTTEMPTTCASKVLKDFTSPYESTPTQRLSDSGAVIIGKCNMDEFAMGTNNDHSYYGKCLNPLYSEPKEYSPGGSSGGSAAAVAANMCDVALGSDTGGSVRLPSAYCGVVGYKPSYGLISRNGVIAYAQSLDTVGILAKNVSLVEDTFNILNAYDHEDPTSLTPEVRDRIRDNSLKNNSSQKLKKLRIGIMEEAIIDLAPEVRQAWIDSLDHLRQLGHEIQVVSVPSLKHALPTYFIISPAEASSNLCRYDGIRYGFREELDRNGQDGNLYAPTRTNAFGHEVQRRILLGTYNLSAGQYGNHYEKAQRVRRKLQREFNSVFATQNVLNENDPMGSIDVLINPTARTRAPPHGQQDHATDAYVNDVLTVPANLAGLPAISVPWGSGTDAVGIQVIGQFGDDQLVLDVAKLLESQAGN